MEESPLIKMINEKFKCISHITDISALSKEDRMKYDESIKIYRDNLAVMSFAEANGREKGRAEEKISIARRMKADGLPTEIIMKYTQLSKEDIEQL
ncbi:hypothetical protein [Bacteroides sp. Marseille-P3684]|uniref:hypothetical protein n=1 Tax=Bacteroides sp. Marseille-P3684 TaxID=2086579 RepID=UPI001F43F699|nr:hypothetical protein [Bacteroides sp. Marseille-P3684]